MTTQAFTVENFAQFWAKPDASLVAHAVTEDVVGHWPGTEEPARGVVAYAARIAQVLALVPDLSLEVLEHAIHHDLLFIRWMARGTGAKGPFTLNGIDRIRLRDGRVAENVIVFDTLRFREVVGAPVPYAGQLRPEPPQATLATSSV
ncbi:ester cyclase [Pendulispora rubella]|uniref:Ester cyclase n=1 Tax=Pendulispora rubella TaxID=2741070 RepID=A0ABZ2KYI3_9BACT